jgi:hypothetical protein
VTVLIGPDGHLYVSNEGGSNVQRYDGTTGLFLGTFASGGGLDNPTYLTFTPQVQPIPEPSTLLLSLVGVGGLLGWRWVQAHRQA